MTKELIEKRVVELSEVRFRILKDLHHIEGALQDCKYWLSLFDELPKKDTE